MSEVQLSNNHIFEEIAVIGQKPSNPSDQHIDFGPAFIVVDTPNHSINSPASSDFLNVERSRNIEFPPNEIVVLKPDTEKKQEQAAPESRAAFVKPAAEQGHQQDIKHEDKAEPSQGQRVLLANKIDLDQIPSDFPAKGTETPYPFGKHMILRPQRHLMAPSFVFQKEPRKEKTKKKRIKLKKEKISGVAQVEGESGSEGLTISLGGLNSESPVKTIDRRIKIGKEIARIIGKRVTSSNDVPWHLVWTFPFIGYNMYKTMSESQKESEEYYEKGYTYDLEKKLEEDNAKRTLESGFGNCGAKASATAYLLDKYNNENGIKERIEIMHFADDADHAWVVVGRDPKSDPKDPNSYGLTAVVVDSWFGKVYEANEFYTHLINMNKTISSDIMVYSE